jgi:hypothetical protein
MGIACLRPSARRPSTFQLTTQNEPGGFAVLGIGSRSVTGSALALATFPRGALTFSATASPSSATAAVSLVLRFVPAAACSSSAGAAFASCFRFGAIFVRGLFQELGTVLTWSGSVLWVRELRLARALAPSLNLGCADFLEPQTRPRESSGQGQLRSKPLPIIIASTARAASRSRMTRSLQILSDNQRGDTAQLPYRPSIA